MEVATPKRYQAQNSGDYHEQEYSYCRYTGNLGYDYLRICTKHGKSNRSMMLRERKISSGAGIVGRIGKGFTLRTLPAKLQPGLA